jgi:hypothetical protein
LLKKKTGKASSKKSVSLNGRASQETLQEKKEKKVTVSLALDDFVVKQIKKQSAEMDQSFNSRVNSILEKYVNFFAQLERDRPAIMPKSLHQFFIDKTDEAEYTSELRRLGDGFIQALFVQTGLAPTIDNLVQFVFELICVNTGSIRSVKSYVDDEDGRICLYFTHDYNTKWSRIISAAFAHLIETVLHLHTKIEVFSESFEIKILEKEPS